MLLIFYYIQYYNQTPLYTHLCSFWGLFPQDTFLDLELLGQRGAPSEDSRCTLPSASQRGWLPLALPVRPPGCPPSAPRSPSGGSEGWAQKARWLLLTPRRSQEAPATGALAGKQTQSGREWTSPFQPLSWAGQGRPVCTGGCGLQLPVALRTASISRECCFSTASRLIHAISPFPYNVYFVLSTLDQQ